MKLTSHEIDFKEANMIRSMVKVGAFPHHKELNDFDFEFQSSINEQEIRDFETLRFLEAAENIVFLGSSGVGKTHLATSIGIAAAKKQERREKDGKQGSSIKPKSKTGKRNTKKNHTAGNDIRRIYGISER